MMPSLRSTSAFQLCSRLEGIIPALESCHALAKLPDIAPKKTEKDNAKCQAAAVTLLNKQTDTVAKEANKAKKAALKGKGTNPPPVAGNGQLEDAIDAALAGNGKILAAAGKIATTLGKKCTDGIIDANFDCGGAATSIATLATCIELTAFQAACETIEAADGIDLACVPVP